jgi:hypothetical protein
MRHTSVLSMTAIAFVILLGTVTGQTNRQSSSLFSAVEEEFSSTGTNPYFVLEPGYTLTLRDGQEQMVVTVLSETKRIGNVETRVVEERETKDGQLVEISKNYFVIGKRTNSVYYFGEDVDVYKNGNVTNHEGAWVAGTNGAQYGLMMPGLPLPGAKYPQELAPKVAMDRAEIVGVNETLTTPAGGFKNVLKILETTPLELGAREYKYYAAGVGLLQDGSLKLVRYGKTGQ